MKTTQVFQVRVVRAIPVRMGGFIECFDYVSCEKFSIRASSQKAANCMAVEIVGRKFNGHADLVHRILVDRA